MRLPNLSPSIDRRRPGSPPAGLGPGAVRPRGGAGYSQVPTCSGPCGPGVSCTNPSHCECDGGLCKPIPPQRPGAR